MLINRGFANLIDEGGRYYLKGDIRSAQDLEIKLDKWLFIEGSIMVEGFFSSNIGIKVSGNIQCNGYMDFGGSLEVGGDLNTKEGIRCADKILVVGNIYSDGDVRASGAITSGGNIHVLKGILSQLSISAKDTIEAIYPVYAGCCTWRPLKKGDNYISCSVFLGKVGHGVLRETGEVEKDYIMIGGQKYSRKEMEESLKHLKPLKDL